MRDPGLTAAITAIGSIAKLAKALGISSPAISQWSRVPADRVLAVEAASGVARETLRPDLYAPARSTPEAAA